MKDLKLNPYTAAQNLPLEQLIDIQNTIIKTIEDLRYVEDISGTNMKNGRWTMAKDKWDFKEVYFCTEMYEDGYRLKWSGYPVWLNTCFVHNPDLKRGEITFYYDNKGQIRCDNPNKEFVRSVMDHFLKEVEYD